MPENVPLQELINLKGKGAIVTGGAAGIGLAISRRLAEAGACVLIADVNGSEANNASNNLNTLGYNTRSVKCDVASEDEVKVMIADAANTLGGIDILVNNAGVYPRKSLEEMAAKDFEQVISVNLLGPFLCSRYAAPEMINKQRGGSIINIASIEAVHPSSSGMSAYDASKGGVLMLTKSMAHDLGSYGIRVNAVAPGSIKTRGVLSQTSTSGSKAQFKEFKSFLSRIALDRMGDADEIARVVLFLASELSSYITGDLIVVDGGYLIS